MKKEEYPLVSIIILNWNGWRDTIECLESLFQIDYPNYNIIILDNRSTDNSVSRIKEYLEGDISISSEIIEEDKSPEETDYIELKENKLYDRQLISKNEFENKNILIKNKENHGFSKGNNIGIKFALKMSRSKYVLLLNNDTVVEENFLKELVKTGEKKKEIGIIGPKTYNYNYDGRHDVINFAGADIEIRKGGENRYGHNVIDKGQFDNYRYVDKIEGSCMLIKRKVFEEIGFLDENFVFFWEETDFCFRAKNKGFKLIYSPNAIIWHKGGKSFRKVYPEKVYYFNRNRILFLKKHGTTIDFCIFLINFFLKEFFYKIRKYKNESNELFFNFLKGILNGFLDKSK